MYDYRIKLLEIDKIRPTEQHSSAYADALSTEVKITGVWTHPLLVDSKEYALMDGHNRFSAAKRLGLKTVPVILLDYEDPAVQLQSWRPGHTFKPEDVWRAARTGELLLPKSTRHVISAQLPFCRCHIEDLRDEKRAGEMLLPAESHPTRAQVLNADYHSFGRKLEIATLSANALDIESPETMAPHPHLRLMLQEDPAMAALLPSIPCRIALGRSTSFPFEVQSERLLLLPPSLLSNSASLSIAARWGIEAISVLQTKKTDVRRLAAILRYGAILIHRTSQNARELLLGGLPKNVAAEIWGTKAASPSDEILNWMAQLLKLPTPTIAKQPLEILPLESPVEEILISNGDSRLVIDPNTGKNRYGITARPRPEAVHFSSSTASSISDYGFLFCDLLRRDLLSAALDDVDDIHGLRAQLSHATIAEIFNMLGEDCEEHDGVLAASGTDTEVLALLLARAADPTQNLVNLLISSGESGRGVKLAGTGRYFDEYGATGVAVEKGGRIWPDFEAETVDIDIRDDRGKVLPLESLDEAFLQAGREALANGARVLAHVLLGSKTGLYGPSKDAVNALVGLAPDRVDVVVDCCQFRASYEELTACLSRGWMVQVSGSKFLTGPPFSGALLFSRGFRDRLEHVESLFAGARGIGFAEDWNKWWSTRIPKSAGTPTFGAPFRWLPALLEAKLLNLVPKALREHAFKSFCDTVRARLDNSIYLRAVDIGKQDQANDFQRYSIVSFEVLARNWDGTLRPLGEHACRQIFTILNSDASAMLSNIPASEKTILGQQFHIGQPVVLGRNGHQKTVLRLVIGARFFNIIGHAGAGAILAALESEISDLMRAIDKLEILAENWWKIAIERQPLSS